MDLKKVFKAGLFILPLLALLSAGCSEDETVTPPQPTDIAGVGYFGAYSASETSVGLVWTPSPDEASAEVLNPAYLIKVEDSGGAVLANLTAMKGDTTVTATGLTEGVIYTFVISMSVDSTAVTDDSMTVQWSPAKRSTTEGDPPTPIQVYETASSSFFSGLDIYSSGIDGPQTLSLVGPFNSLIDLFVYTDPASQNLIIRSADSSTVIPTPKTTTFSSVTDDADSLNFPRIDPPLAATYNTSDVVISGATSGATAGKIIYGKTQENNYFRLLVTRNNNSLVYGTSPNRYLKVQISYQSVSGVQYARPINPEPDLPRRNEEGK